MKKPAQKLSKKRSLISQAKPCMIRISARKAKVPAAMPTTEPLIELVDLLADLGLGELDLLADQRGGLDRDVGDEVAERLVGRILLRGWGCGGHRLSRAGLRRRCGGRAAPRRAPRRCWRARRWRRAGRCRQGA